jgi:hypothetical protein
MGTAAPDDIKVIAAGPTLLLFAAVLPLLGLRQRVR